MDVGMGAHVGAGDRSWGYTPTAANHGDYGGLIHGIASYPNPTPPPRPQARGWRRCLPATTAPPTPQDIFHKAHSPYPQHEGDGMVAVF